MAIENSQGVWLFPNGGTCTRTDCNPRRPLRLVLLGAPGVGKGTQADLISEEFSSCPLSTGDVFRATRGMPKEKISPAMREAIEAMRNGLLVSDDMVIAMVEERGRCLKCGYGFMLDGFPRTVGQAKALDAMLAEMKLELDAVLSYTLDRDSVVERLSGRRTCGKCKTTYHLRFSPPKVEEVCDLCGGELYQRDDDRPEPILKRLEQYEASALPLEEYYKAQGLLLEISAEGSPQTVFERTRGLLRSILQERSAAQA
ncbi:MAG: nucleoside monophosphate kinase [Sumerlaeia bacterium]